MYLKGVMLAVLGIEACVNLSEGSGPKQMAHFQAKWRKMQHTTQIILLLTLIQSIPLTTITLPPPQQLLNIHSPATIVVIVGIIINMSSKPQSIHNHNHSNPAISALISQMSLRSSERDSLLQERVKQERKVCHSSSVKTKRSTMIQSRPYFNNRTKQGQLIDCEFKSIPYVFIPGYKNDTFIAPSRVFEKGKAGKRFVIKMKDTSIFSFRAEEPTSVSTALRKDEKEKTIVSRQNQEYNRVIEENDGRLKAQVNKWFLKTRKRFNPVHASQLFSECQPMLSPKDPELRQTRKISLSKTFDFRNKWRPATRGPEVFSATCVNTPHSQQSYTRSVR